MIPITGGPLYAVTRPHSGGPCSHHGSLTARPEWGDAVCERCGAILTWVGQVMPSAPPAAPSMPPRSIAVECTVTFDATPIADAIIAMLRLTSATCAASRAAEAFRTAFRDAYVEVRRETLRHQARRKGIPGWLAITVPRRLRPSEPNVDSFARALRKAFAHRSDTPKAGETPRGTR